MENDKTYQNLFERIHGIILKQPSQVFAQILRTDPKLYLWRVVAMCIFAGGIWDVWNNEEIPDITLIKISAMFIAPLLLAPIFMLWYYLLSMFCLQVARLLGGTDMQFHQIRAALIWANLPILFVGAVAVFMLLLKFISGLPSAFLGLIMGFVGFILYIWCIVLASTFIGQVCNFSAWRGFFTGMLSIILTVVTILLLLSSWWLIPLLM